MAPNTRNFSDVVPTTIAAPSVSSVGPSMREPFSIVLAIIAPTQRYGYVEAGRPAAPPKELRHIVDVRNASYAFLRKEPVPITDTNYKEYGVTTIPMYVLVDRQGIVRLYHAGRMTEEELDAAIRSLL